MSIESLHISELDSCEKKSDIFSKSRTIVRLLLISRGV